MPQNLHLNESIGILKEKIDKIIKLNGFIVLKGHFVNSSRLSDGWDDKNYKKIKEVIKYLMEKYSKKIKWINYNEIAQKF